MGRSPEGSCLTSSSPTPPRTIPSSLSRAQATATLVYEPARTGARSIESRRFLFTAPLGPIEADDLKWYLESYALWPVGVFQQRAEAIEKKLPVGGRELFQAGLGDEEAREALTAWQQAADGAERRFSIQVDSDLPKGATDEAQALLHREPWAVVRAPAARARPRWPPSSPAGSKPPRFLAATGFAPSTLAGFAAVSESTGFDG